MQADVHKLSGMALDWAVASIEGRLPASYDDWAQTWPFYSTNPKYAYQIIMEVHIATAPHTKGHKSWQAKITHANSIYTAYGSTPLVAAMRCYVISKLGDWISVPEELL